MVDLSTLPPWLEHGSPQLAPRAAANVGLAGKVRTGPESHLVRRPEVHLSLCVMSSASALGSVGA